MATTTRTEIVEGHPSLQRAKKVAAALMVAATVFLHIYYCVHAGGLWRDEVNSIGLATMPGYAELWQNFQFDSLPFIWLGVLRTLDALGLNADGALRTVGLVIGLIPIAVLWFVAYLTRGDAPSLSLALVGLRPTIIRWGDSLRAYGLGLALILVTFALIWKVVRSPGCKLFLLATAAAICSVHTLYYNAVILFAIGIAAAAVAARNRHWYRVGQVLGIGGLAALSMTPYLQPIQNAKQWNNIFALSDFSFSLFVAKVSEALSSAGPEVGWLWVVLIIVTAAVTLVAQRRSIPSPQDDRRDLALYCGVALFVGICTYFVFLKILRYPTQPWYYVVLMGLMAVAIEGALSALSWRWWRNMGLVLLSLAITIGTFLPALSALRVRQTNLDIIAAKVQETAAAGDIIVVAPWYFGITFARYYHGTTPWITLPAIEDHKLHRYDLLKQRMAAANPIGTVLDAMANALGSGHQVWIVGSISYRQPGKPPPVLAPAPHDSVGWSEAAYAATWSMQAAYFLQTHALTAEVISFPDNLPISAYEDAQLILVRGKL